MRPARPVHVPHEHGAAPADDGVHPWVDAPIVEVNADLPLDQMLSVVDAELVTKGLTLLAAIRDEIPAIARSLADAVRLRTKGRFQDMAEAIAAMGDDISWRDVMLANIAYDLKVNFVGCTTVALPGPKGPVLARNMDYEPEALLAQTSCLVRFLDDDGNLIWDNHAWPGSIGCCTGMRGGARGGEAFAIALNSVLCPNKREKSDPTGYPVMLEITRVIEDCHTFEEAVEALSGDRLTAACLLMVVGERNDQRVIIERTAKRAHVRRAVGDEPLVMTNHYHELFEPRTSTINDLYETTLVREQAMLDEYKDGITDEHLTDDGLLSLLSREGIVHRLTAQQTIHRPAERRSRMVVPRRLLHVSKDDPSMKVRR